MRAIKIGKGFGKWLRKARKAAGLTQAALGEKAGVHPVSIAQYETGVCRPSEKSAKKIKACFEERTDTPADPPAPAPEKKRRGRPRKVRPKDEAPKRVKWGRPKKVAEVIEQKVVVEATIPDDPKPSRRQQVNSGHGAGSPARLGIVERDWIDAQIEAHVHSRGWMCAEGQARLVVLAKRDLADLCRIMLQVGGVQIRGAE